MIQLFLTGFTNQSTLGEIWNSIEIERFEAKVKEKTLIGTDGGREEGRMWARGSKRLEERWDTPTVVGVMYV